jgi:TPR repeat protein
LTQDFEQAARWYTLAADKGHAMAQNNLGMLYHGGKGVPVDYLKAIKWYNYAAQQGLAYAQNNLAIMFAFGKGVPQDYVKAYAWLIVAKTNGVKNETFMKYLSSKIPSDQISSAQTLAGKLLAGFAP